ncbi:YiiG family protein [Undibacterium sp. TJN19]|uniref:YiiG family protein n=1 Tax=Undibacterium sp. TJN19 TaxID=3413055 RepID=UPI003BF3DB04
MNAPLHTPAHIASKLTIRLLLALAATALLPACSKKPDNAGLASTTPAPASVGNSQATPPLTTPAEDKSSQAASKLQDYIACYNSLDGDTHRSIARYRSWVKDMSNGPSGKEVVVYGLYKIDVDHISRCKASFAQTAKASPALPRLDAAAESYINALAELGALVADAEQYYSRENYKDDAFAKGRKLHAPLAASMKTFEEKSTVFSDQIEAENDQSLDAEMQRLEKTEGRQLPYLHMAFMSKAKQLMRMLGEETFDAVAAGKLLADYENLADETIAYVKKNSDSASSGWSQLERKTEDFRKAAKERVRRIRDKQAYSEGEKMMLKPGSAWMVDGSQEKVMRAYNDLIEASNRLNR